MRKKETFAWKNLLDVFSRLLSRSEIDFVVVDVDVDVYVDVDVDVDADVDFVAVVVVGGGGYAIVVAVCLHLRWMDQWSGINLN